MNAMARPRVLLSAGDPTVRRDLRGQMETAGFQVTCHDLADDDPSDPANHHLILIDGSNGETKALPLCRRLRLCLREVFVPILFVTGDHDPIGAWPVSKPVPMPVCCGRLPPERSAPRSGLSCA